MRKTAILLALACAFARADYGPGTTDSDLLRSGTPVVTNAWLAVSNETARLVENHVPEVDASRITDGTNMIDAARNVWQSYSGRVCTNANEAWTYSVGGATYTAEQMTDAVGGGDSDYSQTLVWMNSSFIGKDGNDEQFEGWFVIDSSGSRPVGYSYITGETTESSADHFLALAEYVGFDYTGGTNVSITAFRGTFESGTNYVGRLALTNDIPHAVDADLTPATNWANQVGARVASDSTNYTDSVSAILVRESTNAAIAVADAKISTNNAAFVSAVLAVPIAGADAGDLAEIAGYGGYGTVGAAILALIAGLAALKRRMATAETAVSENATAVASVRADLPYALVEPGVWEFSPASYDGQNFSIVEQSGSEAGTTSYLLFLGETQAGGIVDGEPNQLSLTFNAIVDIQSGETIAVTATRASLPGHLLDRAGNRVVVSGDTTLTLPALVNAGKARDLYVRLTVSAAGAGSAVTWTVALGETWDAMGAPPSSFAEGTHLYRITEVAPGVWHAEDMFAVAGKMPMYPTVAVTPSSGTLTVAPYTVATYTAGTSAAAFTVAVGTGTAGMARDCELVIDCTATGAVAPTVTWPSNFHPRTDTATDLAIVEAGKRAVFYISEYAQGEFAVGGWTETEGGYAPNGGSGT